MRVVSQSQALPGRESQIIKKGGQVNLLQYWMKLRVSMNSSLALHTWDKTIINTFVHMG